MFLLKGVVEKIALTSARTPQPGIRLALNFTDPWMERLSKRLQRVVPLFPSGVKEWKSPSRTQALRDLQTDLLSLASSKADAMQVSEIELLQAPIKDPMICRKP